MAKYTIELRRICDIYGRDEVENWFKNYDINNYLTPQQIQTINKYNVWSKDRLASKIVDHYFMREIGFETPALFKHYAKVKMQEIMERQFPKIYSNFLEYDPLSNVDFTEEYTREITGKGKDENINTDTTTQENSSSSSQKNSSSSSQDNTSTSNGTSTSNSSNNASGLNINSDTPQGEISKQTILNGTYASSTSASETESSIEDETKTNSSTNSKLETSNTSKLETSNTSNLETTSNSSSSSNSETNTIEKFTRHQEGDNGVIITNQRLIKEFREIIVAIDEEIIKELNILFMGLY